MAKAYRCDICNRVYDGPADMVIVLNKALETVLRFVLGVKMSPENDDAPTYQKDCCPECATSFTGWYKQQRSKYDGQS